MTIRDIAREAGYAVGTVSRVLNNNPNVSPMARQRIMDVVRRHNFQPNANAKHLKQQATTGIAIIVKGTRNMLFAGILESMQARIESRDYVSIPYYLDEEADEVEQAQLICQERHPNGILFLGSNLEFFDERLKTLGVPCVLVTNSAAQLNFPNLSSVSVDDRTAAQHMVEYLYARGHRRIGVIGGRPELSRPSFARYEGCRAAFGRLGLAFDAEKQYAHARFSMESGYEAMEQLLKTAPDITAVFTMSDLMAVGALRALQDHGLRVPEDISVTGYDGIALARYCIPRLTTISQNVERLAARGVDILLHSVEEESFAIHEIVPFELVEGESVGDISAQNGR